MKKLAIICLLLALLAALLCGCAANTVHCDHCGKEIRVDKNVTEDWLVYCSECNEELFGDDPIIEPVE